MFVVYFQSNQMIGQTAGGNWRIVDEFPYAYQFKSRWHAEKVAKTFDLPYTIEPV